MVKKLWPSIFADVVDAADIRMRDLAGDADFIAEALQRLSSRVAASGRNFSATGWPSVRSSAR